jgi:hypothetical protein
VIETRGGPGGNPVGLFAAEIDGVVLNFFIVLGNFDPLGIWSLSSQVPPSLSGHTLKLRSYAVGFAGAIVDTEDLVVAFP